ALRRVRRASFRLIESPRAPIAEPAAGRFAPQSRPVHALPDRSRQSMVPRARGRGPCPRGRGAGPSESATTAPGGGDAQAAGGGGRSAGGAGRRAGGVGSEAV